MKKVLSHVGVELVKERGIGELPSYGEARIFIRWQGDPKGTDQLLRAGGLY